MSNLSELLPAGAGAKSADFVASGTLSSGQTVVLNSDGTVEAIGTGSPGTGSPTTFATGSPDWMKSAYDSVNDKIVIIYEDDNNSSYSTAIVGTVSGSSISFGTSVVYSSGASNANDIAFDENAEAMVILWRDGTSSNHCSAIVGTVSGSSISFGTKLVVDNTGTTYHQNLAYDTNAQKMLLLWAKTNGQMFAAVGTVSGTSITKGTTNQWDNGDTIAVAYDANAQASAVFFRDSNNSYYGSSRVLTISGTSVSAGGLTVYESAVANSNTAVYDANAQKVVVFYRDAGNSQYGTACVGTISGTSISFGTPVAFTSAAIAYLAPSYNAQAQKIFVAFDEDPNDYLAYVLGTVSGTSISFNASTTAQSVHVNFISTVYDSSNKATVISYQDADSAGDDGEALVYQHAPSNFTDFIGITDQAIADTATGAVIVQGGVSEKAVGPYYISNVGSDVVFEAASTSRFSSAYDSGNQKIVVAYTDAGNSNYGTAIVGTVSGTSISFGTPVVFEAATTYDKAAVYDPDTGKIVIAYRDSSNSNYGTAIVGTVSGTSISFGTAVVYNSALTNVANNGSGAVYDTTNDKVVIAYKDGGNSNYGTGIVGTVSGTSISFGSETVFNTGNTIDPSVAFDSDNSKIIISYRDSGNSSYGTAVVGTVSGTSISFGSEVVFNSATTLGMRTIYDTNADKVLIPYSDFGNSSYGTAVVGTVSGTSISFGTPSVYAEYYTSAQFAVFDSAANQTVICTGGNVGTLNAFAASISGTSVSFSSGTLVSGSTSTYGNLAYDSTNSKIIISYTDSTNSSYGTANVLTLGTDLVIGTDYYVQDDGTLSTTVSSVPAGRALSTTSILLEG